MDRVEVKWLDACGCEGRMKASKAKKRTPKIMRSMGWVLHEDDENLRIVSERCMEGNVIGHLTVIPKENIVGLEFI